MYAFCTIYGACISRNFRKVCYRVLTKKKLSRQDNPTLKRDDSVVKQLRTLSNLLELSGMGQSEKPVVPLYKVRMTIKTC